MEAMGIIRTSSSPWALFLHMVSKVSGGGVLEEIIGA